MRRCAGLAPLVLFARGLARLPQGLLLALSGPLSWLLYPLLARRRAIARINLSLCFPGLTSDQREALLAKNQRATTMGAIELLRAWYAPSKALRGLADVDGLDLLRDALAQGQGVLLLTGHFTHTELATRLLSEALGQRVRAVVRRHNSPCVEEVFEQARSRVAGPTLAKKDVRGLLRALQSGEVVLYSADQNFTYQNAFVPFFGVPAATLTSAPELVRRTQARMLVFFFHRDDDGRYHLRITPAWEGWLDAQPAEAAAIYMRELENEVRAHPAQYLWVHRRFKTRPPGEPALYP